MAAMIWDNESQAFKEADVPMKYDPTAESWTDTTGLAWDNEAQAWTERWGTKVSAYVYGAVSETITIRKNGIVVETVQTDSTGKSTDQITLSSGTYTLTGSVTGWTEEQTVDDSTDRYRAMPEGALYWYGNECIDITGGWVVGDSNMGTAKGSNYLYYKTSGTQSMSRYYTNNMVRISNKVVASFYDVYAEGSLYLSTTKSIFNSANYNGLIKSKSITSDGDVIIEYSDMCYLAVGEDQNTWTGSRSGKLNKVIIL